jgi:APA family basic amino acid/polyamine antiporter
MATPPSAQRPLRRILGLGFGLAIAFGGTVGVGILRLPGTLAAALGDSRLIVLFWVLGGLYAVLGAVAVAELSAMMPQAGGFYVYARRAFGNGVGFVIGWSDWFNNVASIVYASMTATTFLAVLWPWAGTHPRAVALTILASFTAFHWVGLRIGDAMTRVISISVGLMLMALVFACFLAAPVATAAAAPPLANTAISLPLMSLAMLAVVVTALRSVLVTYDGWYSPIYFAEECTSAASNLPRALVGGTLLVAALYVLINIAFLRVLPLSVLAASSLPAAAAAGAVLPRGGALLVTVISLLTVLSLVNATLLMTPRILLAIGRDGFFTRTAASVSASGTPRVALGVTSVMAGVLIVTGTFEQIISLASILFLLNYLSAYAAVFMLRRTQPTAPRPYRAFGFPVTTAIVLVGSVLFLVAAVTDGPVYGGIAGAMIATCVPLYWYIARQRGRSVAAAVGPTDA